MAVADDWDERMLDAIETVMAGWKEPGETTREADGARVTEAPDGRLKAWHRIVPWSGP